MSFVLASADFSCCTREDRAVIYQRLENENWNKIYQDADDIHTVWLNALQAGANRNDAVEMTRAKFYSCCKTNCRPRVVFEWGFVNAPETSIAKNMAVELRA